MKVIRSIMNDSTLNGGTICSRRFGSSIKWGLVKDTSVVVERRWSVTRYLIISTCCVLCGLTIAGVRV